MATKKFTYQSAERLSNFRKAHLMNLKETPGTKLSNYPSWDVVRNSKSHAIQSKSCKKLIHSGDLSPTVKNPDQIQSIVNFIAASSAQQNPEFVDIDGFRYPKIPIKQKSSDQFSVASTSNRFDVLDSTDLVSASENGEQPDEKAKPPAVYIYGIPSAVYIYEITNKYCFTRSLYSIFFVAPKSRHGKDFIPFQVHTQSDIEKLVYYSRQSMLHFITDVPKKD